jgi:hypothetical protein
LTDDKKMEITNPVDVFEHANAEVEAMHIHCIGPFPFPRGLGPAWHMRSSSCRSVEGVHGMRSEMVMHCSYWDIDGLVPD